MLRSVGTTATMGVLLAAVVALPTASAAPLAGAPKAGAAADAAPMTQQRAQVQAAATGKDVQATAATTENSTLTVHPNGTFTVTQSLAPVRKRVGGGWVDLDPTLHRKPDGSIGTTATSSELTLSGGGGGPLATMQSQGRSLALSLPMTLPAPTLSGPTALYANVLDGVDLKVTADSRGSFSEVLVVKDAKAAANPALAKLTLATKTSAGLKLTADAAGNITAGDKAGHPVFTAPAPRMWDSATAAPAGGQARAAVQDPVSHRAVNPKTGEPVASDEAGPGEGAHAARIAAQVTPEGISLTPAASLLTSATTAFPLFIDPTFYPPSAPGSRQAWAQTNSTFPDQALFDSGDSEPLRVGYNGWQSPYFAARSYVQVSVEPSIYDATVLSSELDFNGIWSGDCTKTPTELWLVPSNTGDPRNTLSNNTTWNNDPQLTTYLGSRDDVFWGGTDCDPHPIGFDIRGAMGSAASQHLPSLTFGLKASDESNRDSWKKFSNKITVSTTYNHAPDKSTNLSTSPNTSCAGGSYALDGDVWLYGAVSDRDGGTLGATFHAVKHGTNTPIVPDSDPSQLTAQNGNTLAFKLPKASLESAAAGQLLTVDWTVTTTDFNLNGATSTTCSFIFDSTRPGQPNLTVPDTSVIGTAVAINVTPNVGNGSVTPSSYQYQLNGGAPQTVTATGGNATIMVTPNRRTNILSVTALSAGGNFGQPADRVMNSAAPAPQSDGDLSGDNRPDLLTVGGRNGLPSGLWLARGQSGTGAGVTPSAANIGSHGNGYDTAASPAAFDGAQAITGQFTGGNLQDVLVYYPGTTGGAILNGTGDGSPILAQLNGNSHTLTTNSFQDINSDNPSRLVAAGNTAGNGTGYPDLLGISGDTGNGYSLNLYQAQPTTGSFQFPVPLGVTTPTGGQDWNNWTIASCQVATVGGPKTALYLWNKATGELDLWQNLAADPNTGALTHAQQVTIAAHWNAGQDLTLQAADINGDGTPDVWAVMAGGTVVTLQHDLTGHQPDFNGTDKLLTSSHTWPLNNGTTGAATSAADTTGGLPLTGSGGTSWHTGDLFSPDAKLDGTGVLTTAGKAITPTSDFTVAAWVKPDTLNASGGVGSIILSQDGALASSFALWVDASTKLWKFQMPRTDSATPTQDIVTSGTTAAQAGSWTHLTATYQASTGKQTLYVNGVQVGSGTHTNTSWATNNSFVVGSYLYNGGRGLKFGGQVSTVQTWNQSLSDTQVASVIGLPPAPAELQLTALTSGGNLAHTTRNAAPAFSPWDLVVPMAYIPMGFRSATQAEAQGTTYLAAVSSALEFQIRPYGSTTWTSPTGTDAPLPLQVGTGSVSVDSVSASAITGGNFDLIGLGTDGQYYEALRHPDGTWTGWSNLSAKIGNTGSIGAIQELAAATTTGGDLQLVAVAGGKLWHALRNTAGQWTVWGDVFANSSNPGTATHVAAAGVRGELQVMVSTSSGGLYHAIRPAAGRWTVFGDVLAATNSNPGPIASIAMAGTGLQTDNAMQFSVVNSSGTVYHGIRYPTSWTVMGNVSTYVQGTIGQGTVTKVIAAGD